MQAWLKQYDVDAKLLEDRRYEYLRIHALVRYFYRKKAAHRRLF